MTRVRCPAAILAAIALLGSSACATTWAAIQIGGGKTYSTDGHETSRIPTGDSEQRLEVELRSVSPLTLGCTLEVRTHEHVRETWHRWGTGWKVVGGFAFVAEALIGAAGLVGSVGRSDRHVEVAAFGYLSADALATGVLLLTLSPETNTNEYDAARPWVAEARCPEGLAVRAGDEAVAIGGDGQLSTDRGTAIARTAFLTGAPVTLQWGPRVEALPLSSEQRCAWASAAGEPSAGRICAPPVASFSPAGFAPPSGGAYREVPVVRPGPPFQPLRLRIDLTVPNRPTRSR